MSKFHLLFAVLLSMVLVSCPEPITPTKPVISSFTATPALLPVGGGSSKLEWQVTGADSITIDRGTKMATRLVQSKLATGLIQDVKITDTTTFTLNATNAQGTTTQTLTITVAQNQAPTMLSGTITPWTRGVRLVKGNTYTSGIVQSVIAGDMTATGAFSVPLVDVPNTSLTPLFNGQSNCATSLNVNPVNLKVLGLTQLNVVTNTGASTGALVQTNLPDPITNLSFQAGSKFTYYIYADQNSTVKGNCANQVNGGTNTIDWTLKQGWNATLVEYTSNTDAKFTVIPANAVPSDIAWKFIPATGGVVTIANPIATLEFGKSVTLKAIATELDGTPIASPELIWTSSNPAVADVSTDGVVTAKQTSDYYTATTISVALKNSPATGVTMYLTTYGISATGGTFNLENAALGTAARIRYQAPSGVSTPTSLGFTITGPSGWNNDQPYTGTFTPGYGYYQLLTEIPAVTGSYQIQTNDLAAPKLATRQQGNGDQGFVLARSPLQYPRNTVPPIQTRAVVVTGSGTTFTVDTSKKIAPAPDFRITSFQSNQIGVSWGTIPNFDQYATYYNTLTLEVRDQTTGQIISPEQQVSSSPTYTNTYQTTFDTSHTYAVRLTLLQGLQVQAAQPLILNASRATAILDFHPEITQLNYGGGASAGGYNLTINGYNFDANTSVFFGTVEATSKSLQGSTSIQVIVPAGVAGTVDVKVSNTRGSSAASAITKFKYYDVQEFNTFTNNGKLLAANNGVYFIEQDDGHTPPVSLSKIDTAGTITRVWLSDVPAYYYARDMTADSAGNVWVLSDTKAVKVATNNQVSSVALPSGLLPAMMAVGSDGNLWIARLETSAITRMQTDGSNVATFPLAGASQYGSSFSNSNEMLLAPDGNIWFTNGYGYGKVTPSGAVTVLNSSSYSIGTMTLFDNALWINSGGSFIRLNTDGTTVTYTGSCSGNRFTRGSDAAFWCAYSYSGYGDLQRTVLTGTTGSTQSIILPTYPNSSSVADIASDANGKLWFVRGTKIGFMTP